MSFDFSQVNASFDKVVSFLDEELKVIKTGRAKPSLVEDVMAEAYGSKMPLKELGSITAPDPHMLVVQPWDQSVIEAIEKALQQSQFNPAVDGNMIRISIPPLTGEKRQELAKQVSQKVESVKQMLRSERVDFKKKIEAQKDEAGVSEDDIKADLEQLDKLAQDYTGKLEAAGKEKQEEVTTI